VKVLLDNNVPVGITKFLTGHDVVTAFERGWEELKNAVLLSEAEAAGFDVLITADQNIEHQQNLSGRRLAIVVLGSNSWPVVRTQEAEIAAAVNKAVAGTYQFIEMPPPPRPAPRGRKDGPQTPEF